MLILLYGILLWASLCQGALEEVPFPEVNVSSTLSSFGYPTGLFLTMENCPSTYFCREPLGTKSKVLPKWDELNCQCDDACATYGDCCVNAPAYDADQARIARHHWKCVNLVNYQGLYMLMTCPATWDDPATRSLCEQKRQGDVDDDFHSPRDPLAATPVTNPRTRFTYRNYYCALCNEDAEGAIYWTTRLQCPELWRYNATYHNLTDAFVWRSLRYDDSTESWGIPLPNFNVTHRSPTQVYVDSVATCEVLVQMPVTVADMVRQCHTWVDDCPATWHNATVRKLCHSYTATVYEASVSYRNVHCAICNGRDVAMLECYSGLLYRNVNPAAFAPSFAFLFDINENGGNVVGTTQRCKGKSEVYDPFFKICREMVCAGPRYKLREGKCILQDSPATSSTQRTLESTPKMNLNETVPSSSPSTTEVSMLNVSGPTTEWTTSAVPEFNASHCVGFNISQFLYQIFANGSIYIAKYDRMYAPGEYIAADDGSIFICIPFTDDDANYLYERKFSLVLAYLTLAGLGISLTCIVIHLLAFMVVPSLRNLSGKNLASLCVALISAYVTFIISQFDNVVSKEACTAIAVILYYSFLSSFFWMNSIAFDVWRTLRLATSELRVSSGQQWSKFVAYSAYSWFGPAVIVAVSIIVENSSQVPKVFKPAFGVVTCWFGSRRALLIFFVAPVVTIVLLNILMFGLSAYIIVSASQPSAHQQQGGSGKARRQFRLYLRLALIMGLTWTFGVVAGQVDKEPLWYVFIIMNTLQGLFIFLSFTCTDKVWAYLRDRVFLKKASYYSSSRGARARKFELEGRDSGSGESQSSQTSHLSFTRTSQLSRTSSEKKY